MSRSILVTGGAGEIGSRLVRWLVQAGHRVRVLTLPADPCLHRLAGLGCEVVEGDITREETLPSSVAGIDTVYHLAAVLLEEREALFARVNVEGTRNILAAATAAGVRHLIHVSSASVVYPRSTPYSRSKRAGEALVQTSSLPHTIVRPTLVYDDEGGLEFRTFSRFVTRYPLVPLVGDGGARKRPLHADDLVQGLGLICDNPVSLGKTYNLSGPEVITIRELAELLQQRHGIRRPLVPTPLTACRLAAAVVGRVIGRPMLMRHTLAGLSQHADLDNSLACQELGFAPRGVREGLAGVKVRAT